MSMMDKLLRLMQEKQASDVYLSPGAPAMIRVNGYCAAVNSQILSPDAPRVLLAEILPQQKMKELSETGELNTAYTIEGLGRYRISAMRQRGVVAVVVRFIRNTIPALDSLNLPPVLADLALAKRGLILFAGAAGAGKSTSLAAMLDHRSKNVSGHILTIEDPIEYLFEHRQSVVNQREVGVDTASVEVALKNAMRQAPDVIMLGEIRDRETMSAALAYAQSGHLCLSTIHASNSYQALTRIGNFYPVESRKTLQGDLASALGGIVSQRLLRTTSGKRVPACEVLLNTKLVSDQIEKGDFLNIREAIEKSMTEGAQTFETDIARLVREGIVDRKEGLAHADSATNLLWLLQNNFDPHSASSLGGAETKKTEPPPEPDEPSFTEIVLDIH